MKTYQILFLSFCFLSCFVSISQPKNCFVSDFPRLITYNSSGTIQNISYYSFDQVNTTTLVVGGALSIAAGSSYPYLEQVLTSGMAISPQYIDDSSLCCVMAVKYGTLSSGGNAIFMLYGNTLSLIMGFVSLSNIFQARLFNITALNSNSRKPSMIALSQTGVFSVAGQSLSTNWALFSIDPTTGSYSLYQFKNGYADSISVTNSNLFLSGYDSLSNFHFSIFSSSGIINTLMDQVYLPSSALNSPSQTFVVKAQDALESSQGNFYLNTCFLGQASDFAFTQQVFNSTGSHLFSAAVKSTQAMTGADCISVSSVAANQAIFFLSYNSNLNLGFLNFSSLGSTMMIMAFNQFYSANTLYYQGMVSNYVNTTSFAGYFVGSTTSFNGVGTSYQRSVIMSLASGDTTYSLATQTPLQINSLTDTVGTSAMISVTSSSTVASTVMSMIPVFYDYLEATFPSHMNSIYTPFSFPTMTNETYIVGQNALTVFYSPEPAVSACADAVYQVMNTPFDFVTLDYSNSKYIVYSTNESDVGSHSFKLSVNTNNQQTATFSVMITILSPCYDASFTSAPASYNNITYSIGELQQTFYIYYPSINVTSCSFTNMLFDFNTNLQADPSIFNTASYSFKVYTTNASAIGNYTLFLRQVITPGSVYQDSLPFTVSIISSFDCNNTVIYPSWQDLYYDVSSGLQTNYTIEWTQLYPSCPAITYSITNLASLSFASAITLSGSTISIQTSNTALLNQNFTLDIKGSIGTITSASQTYELQFISCSNNQVYFDYIYNQSFNIGDSPFVLFPSWFTKYPICGNITYSLQITGSSNNLEHTFNSKTGELDLTFPSSTSSVSTYSLILQGSVYNIPGSFMESFYISTDGPCKSILLYQSYSFFYEMVSSESFYIYNMNYSTPSTQGLCGDFSYTLVKSGTSVNPGSEFALSYTPDLNNVILTVNSTNYSSRCFTYEQLTLIGSYYNAYPTQLFNDSISIYFSCQCKSSNLVAPPTYTIDIPLGDNNLNNFSMPYFYFSLGQCWSGINYTLTQIGGSTTLNTSVITNKYGNTMMQFEVPNNLSLFGNYSFTLNASTILENVTHYNQTQVNVNIGRGCNTALITNSTLFANTSYYLLNGTTQYLYFSQFSADTGFDQNCGPIIYEVQEYVNGVFQAAPSYITSSSWMTVLKVQSNDSSLNGTHRFNLIGYIKGHNSSYQSYQFNITMISCIATALKVPTQGTFFQYQVGKSAMTFYIQPFSFDYFCSGVNISYNDLLINGNSLTKAVTFDPNQLSFTVQSYSQSDVGTYLYQVIGSAVINGSAINQTLNITISITQQSYLAQKPPYFATGLESLVIQAGTSQTYTLPKIISEQGDKVDLRISNLPNFGIQLNKALVFNPSMQDIGNYTISIILQDQNQSSLLASYALNVLVNSSKTTNMTLEARKYLKLNATSLELNGITIKKSQLIGSVQATITDVSQTGQVAIKFETNMLIPNNVSALVFYQALEFYLIKINGDVLDLNPNTQKSRLLTSDGGWDVVMYAQNQLHTQLLFSDPTNVSTNGVRHCAIQIISTILYNFVSMKDTSSLVKTSQMWFSLTTKYHTKCHPKCRMTVRSLPLIYSCHQSF